MAKFVPKNATRLSDEESVAERILSQSRGFMPTRATAVEGPQVEAAPEQAQTQGIFSSAASLIGKTGRALNDARTGIARGLAKDVVSTITGASGLGQRFLEGTLRAGIKTITPKEKEEERLRRFGVEKPLEVTAAEELIPERFRVAEGPAEKFGFAVGELAQFLIPSSGILKVGKAVGRVPALARAGKAGQLVGQAAVEAVTAGGIRTIQLGKADEQAGIAAVTAGLFPGLGAAAVGTKRLFGKGLTEAGEKIATTVIKPSSRDIKDGFKISTITDNNLGGSLEQTLAKSSELMNRLSRNLAKKLEGSDATVNLNRIFNKSQKRIVARKARAFGDIRANERVLGRLQEEIKEVAGQNGIVDLVQATDIKRGAGTKGAWVFGSADPDATATERVFTVFTQELRKEIEKAAPKGIRGINKQLSDLIPVQNAVLRRIPIAERNNALSLTDSLGLFSAVFDPRALAILGANRLSKSGRFANFLVKSGQKLREKPVRTVIGERVFGATEEAVRGEITGGILGQ